jgi:hypothetical protein
LAYDLQVEASLQLSIYSYATAMNGLADEHDLRLHFDVLTKTRQPELHRYWSTRDRAANVRVYRLAAEILGAIESGVFPPRVGWHCEDTSGACRKPCPADCPGPPAEPRSCAIRHASTGDRLHSAVACSQLALHRPALHWPARA